MGLFGRKKQNAASVDFSGKYQLGQVDFGVSSSTAWLDVARALDPNAGSPEDWSRAAATRLIADFGWDEDAGTVSQLEFMAQLNGWVNVAKVAKPAALFVFCGKPAYGCLAACWVGVPPEKNVTPESELAVLHKDKAIARRLAGGIESEVLDLDSGRVLHARYRMNDSFGDKDGVVEKDCYTIFSPIFGPAVQVFGSWIELEASDIFREEIFKFANTLLITPRPEFARPEPEIGEP